MSEVSSLFDRQHKVPDLLRSKGGGDDTVFAIDGGLEKDLSIESAAAVVILGQGLAVRVLQTQVGSKACLLAAGSTFSTMSIT